MWRYVTFCLFGVLLVTISHAASKPHVVTLGKWQLAKWVVGASDEKILDIRVRGLFVDGRLREYTVGQIHEVTERLFVIRRAFRVNDALPGENLNSPQWRWERGGWLAVDRMTGRVSAVALPLLDSFYSASSWYRDYIAYCGISDDGRQIYAVVAQLGRRKPLLRKYMAPAELSDIPDSACAAPRWERKPVRVTFEVKGENKLAYAVHTRALDIVDDNGEEVAE